MKNSYKITILFAIFLLPVYSFAQCLPGWGFYQPITINNSLAQTLTNYQVKITVNTAAPILAGNMNSSGNDIRFADGSCGNINYWIESGINTASTVIWVKVPTIAPSGNTTINMYYGSPSAPAASNGDGVFLFFDDFSGPSLDLVKWTVRGTPSVMTQSGGILTFAGNSNWEYIRSNTTWTGAVTIDSKEYSNGVSAAMIMGYTGTDNRFTFRENASNLKGITFDPDVSGGNSWFTNTFPAVEHSSASYYDYTINADFVASTIMINKFCNNTTSNCNTTPTALNSTTGTGYYVGFSSYAGAYIENVDWIKVREFASQEPVATAGSQQANAGISTSALTSTLFCAGTSLTVDFTANGTFLAGNIFTAELSDGTGSFAAPVAIGRLASTSSGLQTVNVMIPLNTTTGSGYRIRVVSSNPSMTGTDNGTNLSIDALPVIVATVATSTICNGHSDTLYGSGGFTYVWSTGPTSSMIIVNPTVTTTYILYGTSMNGCTHSDTVFITVNQLPVVYANALAGMVCEGGMDMVSAGGANTYLWSTSDTLSSFTVMPTATTTYYVTGTDTNGCENTDSVTVIVNLNPVISISSANDTACNTDAPIALTGTPAGGAWSGPGVTGSTLDPTLANLGVNTATYAYTDSAGCSASDSLSIFVDVCLGSLFPVSGSEFSVYPNPNNGTFTFYGNEAVEIELYDALGQLVEKRKVIGSTQEIFTIETSGLYTLTVIASDGTREVQRVIVN